MNFNELVAKAAAGALSAEDCEQLVALEAEQRRSADAMRSQLDAARVSADSAKRELAAFQRREKITELAAKFDFSDPDYLGYLVERRQIDLDDPEQTEAFYQQLATEIPLFFSIALPSGAGSGVDNVFSAQDGIAEVRNQPSAGHIAKLLESAPEVI